jgi:nucleotide-binding universal stress UspA family protein
VKLLAGYLTSEQGEAAMQRAAELARLTDGELHLVAQLGRPSHDAAAEDGGAQRRRLEAELQRTVDRFRDQGTTCHAHLPSEAGRPSDAILTVAEREGVDTIVIGLRRRSLVGKLVLGSNAQEILSRATCDVLAVKAGRDADRDARADT